MARFVGGQKIKTTTYVWFMFDLEIWIKIQTNLRGSSKVSIVFEIMEVTYIIERWNMKLLIDKIKEYLGISKFVSVILYPISLILFYQK